MEERTSKIQRRVHIRVDVYEINKDGQLKPLDSYIDGTTSGTGTAKKTAEKKYGLNRVIIVNKVKRDCVVPTDKLNEFIEQYGEWVEVDEESES